MFALPLQMKKRSLDSAVPDTTFHRSQHIHKHWHQRLTSSWTLYSSLPSSSWEDDEQYWTIPKKCMKNDKICQNMSKCQVLQNTAALLVGNHRPLIPRRLWLSADLCSGTGLSILIGRKSPSPTWARQCWKLARSQTRAWMVWGCSNVCRTVSLQTWGKFSAPVLHSQ